MAAAAYGNDELLAMLIKAGANMHACDVLGRTYLDYSSCEDEFARDQLVSGLIDSARDIGAHRNFLWYPPDEKSGARPVLYKNARAEESVFRFLVSHISPRLNDFIKELLYLGDDSNIECCNQLLEMKALFNDQSSGLKDLIATIMPSISHVLAEPKQHTEQKPPISDTINLLFKNIDSNVTRITPDFLSEQFFRIQQVKVENSKNEKLEKLMALITILFSNVERIALATSLLPTIAQWKGQSVLTAITEKKRRKPSCGQANTTCSTLFPFAQRKGVVPISREERYQSEKLRKEFASVGGPLRGFV